MKTNEKKDEQKINEIDEPSVFAVPCDMPFVVDPKKAKEFLGLKPNPELLKKIEETRKKLNINIEVDIKPIEYSFYAVHCNEIVTVPYDPKRKERELKVYKKFIKQMKKIEEEKSQSKSEGPILKKVNNSNKE